MRKLLGIDRDVIMGLFMLVVAFGLGFVAAPRSASSATRVKTVVIHATPDTLTFVHFVAPCPQATAARSGSNALLWICPNGDAFTTTIAR